MKLSIKSGLLFGIVMVAVGFGTTALVQRPAFADDDTNIPDADHTQLVGKELFYVHCSTCHGPVGQGTKGVQQPATGPALKGNQFIISAPEAMIWDVIRHGRTGARRHYDDAFPDMPSFDATRIEDLRPLIAYLKGNMQKDGETPLREPASD
jgi:mono/diheme cytochrome c family protein